MKNLYKYTLVIGLTVVFSFGGSASVFAQETVASIDARIAEIQVEIQSLLKQIQKADWQEPLTYLHLLSCIFQLYL